MSLFQSSFRKCLGIHSDYSMMKNHPGPIVWSSDLQCLRLTFWALNEHSFGVLPSELIAPLPLVPVIN